MGEAELRLPLVEQALLEASESYVSMAGLTRIAMLRTGSDEDELMRMIALGIASELVYSGWVDVIDYVQNREIAGADPAAMHAIWSATRGASFEQLQSDPYLEFPLTVIGWQRAIEIGERDGQWKYVWRGEPYVGPGGWRRRSI